MRRIISILAVAIAAPAPALADRPVVENATAERAGDGWRFAVTVSHPDTGWDHYADGWEVAAPDGARLGFRELMHPHVDEQPFTRSLGDVTIPEGVETVHIRARDNVHGWSEENFILDLPGR